MDGKTSGEIINVLGRAEEACPVSCSDICIKIGLARTGSNIQWISNFVRSLDMVKQRTIMDTTHYWIES